MTNPAEGPDDDGQREADRQTDAMKVQLRKDVDSWSKARSEPSTALIAEASTPVARKPPASPPATKAKKPASPKPTTDNVGVSKRPFSMSYGGLTAADYIQYMLDRGLR
jgi:cell division septation protein DedD